MHGIAEPQTPAKGEPASIFFFTFFLDLPTRAKNFGSRSTCVRAFSTGSLWFPPVGQRMRLASLLVCTLAGLVLLAWIPAVVEARYCLVRLGKCPFCLSPNLSRPAPPPP